MQQFERCENFDIFIYYYHAQSGLNICRFADSHFMWPQLSNLLPLLFLVMSSCHLCSCAWYALLNAHLIGSLWIPRVLSIFWGLCIPLVALLSPPFIPGRLHYLYSRWSRFGAVFCQRRPSETWRLREWNLACAASSSLSNTYLSSAGMLLGGLLSPQILISAAQHSVKLSIPFSPIILFKIFCSSHVSLLVSYISPSCLFLYFPRLFFPFRLLSFTSHPFILFSLS